MQQAFDPESLVSCDFQPAGHMDAQRDVRFVWHGALRKPEQPLSQVLRLSSPQAAIVASMSMTPDVGAGNVRGFTRWLESRTKNAVQRGLVLHYRAGRLPAGWSSRFTRAKLRSTARSGLVREAFWSSFWPLLHAAAVEERARELRVAQARRAACTRDAGSPLAAASEPCPDTRRVV